MENGLIFGISGDVLAPRRVSRVVEASSGAIRVDFSDEGELLTESGSLARN